MTGNSLLAAVLWLAVSLKNGGADAGGIWCAEDERNNEMPAPQSGRWCCCWR